VLPPYALLFTASLLDFQNLRDNAWIKLTNQLKVGITRKPSLQRNRQVADLKWDFGARASSQSTSSWISHW